MKGSEIMVLRKQNNMTLKNLGEKIGYSIEHLSKVEHNHLEVNKKLELLIKYFFKIGEKT